TLCPRSSPPVRPSPERRGPTGWPGLVFRPALEFWGPPEPSGNASSCGRSGSHSHPGHELSCWEPEGVLPLSLTSVYFTTAPIKSGSQRPARAVPVHRRLQATRTITATARPQPLALTPSFSTLGHGRP